MSTDRKTAIVVGVLFIIATGFFILGQSIYSPLLESSDYVHQAVPARSTILAGILIEFIAVLAIPLIPVFLYSILKRHDETLSLGYLIFRTLEAVLILISIVGSLSLFGLAQGFLDSTGADVSYFQIVGNTIRSGSEWAFTLSLIVFCIDAMMLNWVLFRARLVPRLISVWGLAGAAWLLVGTVLILFEAFPLMPQLQQELIFATAIAVNEMVLAVWLILKGFSPATTTADSSNAINAEIQPIAAG